MPDLWSTFGKKIMSCHVCTYVSQEIRTRADRAERAWIEQSAPRIEQSAPRQNATEYARYLILVYVEIREKVHNTLSTVGPQLNTPILKRI